MIENPSSNPPPGWYPDPQTPGMLRWWDGGQWSNDIRPADTAQTGGQDGGSRLRPISDWMTETFRLLVNNAAALFTLVVVLVVPASLLFAGVLWGTLRDVVIRIDDNAPSDEFPISVEGFEDFSLAGTGGLLILGLLLNILLTLVFSVSGTRLVMSGRFGEAMSWSKGLASGFRRLPAMIGWTIVGFGLVVVAFIALVVVTAVAGAVSGGLAVLVGLIAFLGVGLLLFGRYSMIFSSPMVGATGSRNPRTVHRITSGLWGGLLGRTLLLVLVTTAASFAGSVITGPLGAVGGAQSPTGNEEILRIADMVGGNIGIFMIIQLISAIVSAFTVLLWHVGMSVLFEDLGGDVDPELRTPTADTDFVPAL